MVTPFSHYQSLPLILGLFILGTEDRMVATASFTNRGLKNIS